MVLDEALAHRELVAAKLRCPGCSGSLRCWGFARPRSLWLSCGDRVRLRPRRARCRDCGVTQVLLPALAPPRSSYAMDVVGSVLLRSAQGQSHRSIATRLDLPADTVRGWIRRVSGRAEWLRVQGVTTATTLDPMLGPIDPAPGRTALADAVEALGVAAAAAQRLFGPSATPWQLIAMLAGGQLLTPLRTR